MIHFEIQRLLLILLDMDSRIEICYPAGLLHLLAPVAPLLLLVDLVSRVCLISLRWVAFSIAMASLIIFNLLGLFFKADLGRP